MRTWQLTEHERSVEADLAAKTALALERERRKGEVEETSWQMFLALAAKAREMLAFRWKLSQSARMERISFANPPAGALEMPYACFRSAIHSPG